MIRESIASGEKGATMIEYALTIALISAASIFSVNLIGLESNKSFVASGNAISRSSKNNGGHSNSITGVQGNEPGGGIGLGTN